MRLRKQSTEMQAEPLSKWALPVGGQLAVCEVTGSLRKTFTSGSLRMSLVYRCIQMGTDSLSGVDLQLIPPCKVRSHVSTIHRIIIKHHVSLFLFLVITESRRSANPPRPLVPPFALRLAQPGTGNQTLWSSWSTGLSIEKEAI